MIFYTLAAFDVHKPWISAFGRTWPVSGFIGRVLLRDVGKRVYHVDGILQVENDEQRDARVRQEVAPMLPAEVHARFQEIVARALAKPLNDCPPAMPARPCDKVKPNDV